MQLESYTSLEEKELHFESHQIDSKKDLESIFKKWSEKDNEQRYIFRGVNEAKFKLYNSAQRAWVGNELDRLGRSYKDFIKTQINKAKNYNNGLLLKFYNSFGHNAYDFSILSFLQHYGAPTPLLDFTYNFKHALFFATDGMTHYPSDDIENYFSIYAIDTNQNEFTSLLRHLLNSTNDIDDLLESVEDEEIRDNINTSEVLNEFEELSYDTFHGLKLFYVPGYIPGGRHFSIKNRPKFRLVYNQHNLNIINQEGLFVFNSDESKPLEEYFTGNRNSNSPFYLQKIICWNIHKSLKELTTRKLLENKPIPIDKSFIYPQEEDIAKMAYTEFLNFK